MKTITPNYKGKVVVELCKELKRNGYNVNETDRYDKSLQTSVKEFQNNKKLMPDGIVGYRTWEALLFGNRPQKERLTNEDFQLLAQLLDCETAAIRAVCEVETGMKGGFLAPGIPVVLFEGHIFWEQLKKRGIPPLQLTAENSDILHPNWERNKYKKGVKEFDRLLKARKIDRQAADSSASWGMFQIMGFNHTTCGEPDIDKFVAAMCESERKQLILSGRFLRQSGALPSLRSKDWEEFARIYNGPAYKKNNYDIRLKNAYRKYCTEK